MSIEIKGVIIGEGKPKVCVPIVEDNDEAILDKLKEFDQLDVDIIELRIDFYKNIREELDFNWTPILKLVNKGETISEYTYLSEEYYEIKDDTKKAQAKEKFVEDFKTWMANIYE